MNIKYKANLKKKYIHFLTINTMLFTIATVLTLSGPLVIKYALDNHTTGINSKKTFIIFFILLIIAFLFRLIINKIQYVFSYKFKVNEAKYLYENMFKMKYKVLISKEPTYMIERINIAINTLASLFGESISGIVVSTITILITLIFIFFINKILFLLFIILIPLQYFGYKKLNLKLVNKSQNLQSVCAKNFKDIISIVSNVDHIKQSGNLDGILSLVERNICNIEKANCSVTKFARDLSQLLDFLISLLQNAIYIYVVYSYMNNKISIADMVFITLINSIFFSALKQLTQTNLNLRDLKGAISFIEEEIFDNLENNGQIIIDKIDKIDVKIKDLGYDDTLIIEGNFSNVPGEIVAVIGKSGSGKSTLMRCLNKIIESDNTCINGNNVNSLKNEQLREKIAVISQNILIIPLSIKDNILLGQNVSTEKWNALINKSFMKKFTDLKDGLETIIKENGSNLSGGDKQKIALARLFINEPDVIILDEATNSIDKITVDEIMRDLIDNYANKIIYIITHGEYMLKYCNRLINIEDKLLKLEIIK